MRTTDIFDRFKKLRSDTNLSQTEFGKRVGVTIGVIKNIESKIVEPKDIFVKLVCKEYGVNYLWLKEGKGDMYNDNTDTIIEELSIEYDLDDMDKKIIQTYIQLDHDERAALKNFIKSIIQKE